MSYTTKTYEKQFYTVHLGLKVFRVPSGLQTQAIILEEIYDKLADWLMDAGFDEAFVYPFNQITGLFNREVPDEEEHSQSEEDRQIDDARLKADACKDFINYLDSVSYGRGIR